MIECFQKTVQYLLQREGGPQWQYVVFSNLQLLKVIVKHLLSTFGFSSLNAEASHEYKWHLCFSLSRCPWLQCQYFTSRGTCSPLAKYLILLLHGCKTSPGVFVTVALFFPVNCVIKWSKLFHKEQLDWLILLVLFKCTVYSSILGFTKLP